MDWTEQLGTPDRPIETNKPSAVQPSRPISVTLLALGVLILSAFNLIRLATILKDWKFWQDLLPIPPMYLAISGGIWMITWAWLSWGLWNGQAWVGRFGLIIPLAYSLYYWMDRLLLKQQAENPNTPFAAVLNILILILYAWLLARPPAQSYLVRNRTLPGEKK